MKTGWKSKQWITVALGLFALGGGLPARAGDGTGIGGGDGAAQARALQLASTIQPVHLSGRGFPPAAISALDQWCEQVESYLSYQHERALSQIQDQHFALALATLKATISTALQTITLDPGLASPLTRQMLERGRELDSALAEALAGEGKRGVYTEVLFMTSYIGFVVDTSTQLDRPLFVPHLADGGGGNLAREFTDRYLQYAHDQLAYVNGRFIRKVERDGHFVGVPSGASRVYFTIAALVSRYVAEDVSVTLAAEANACVIRQLNDTSQQLTDYLNTGEDPILRDAPYAVDKIRRRLGRLDRELTTSVCDFKDL